MGKVVFDISMSLDGFITAANQRPEQPMGEGGERLHKWAFGNDPRDREVLTGGAAALGAVICGRRTYDDSLPWWGADGPTGPPRVPVFVLSHDLPAEVPEGGVYTFVTGGIEPTQATLSRDLRELVLGAGLVDEVSIHLVPVLFGDGTRMFEHLGDRHVQLENAGSTQTAAPTHLRFRVVGG